MFPTRCPIMNTLPVNELGSVPQQTCLFFVQCFCRLNAHDLTGRVCKPRLTIMTTIDTNVIACTIRKRVTVTTGIVSVSKSIKARFRLMTAAGTAASINNKTPSPISKLLRFARVDPKASRSPISERRCCVRIQNVPITPIRMFSKKKPKAAIRVFTSFIFPLLR